MKDWMENDLYIDAIADVAEDLFELHRIEPSAMGLKEEEIITVLDNKLNALYKMCNAIYFKEAE